MNPDLMRLIYVMLVLALLLPGAISMARQSSMPIIPSLLFWGGLLALIALGHDWWLDWNAGVTGSAVLDEPAPPRYGPLRP